MRRPSKWMEPACGLIRGCEQVEQGALARARGADDADEFAFVNVEIDAVQHRHRRAYVCDRP